MEIIDNVQNCRTYYFIVKPKFYHHFNYMYLCIMSLNDLLLIEYLLSIATMNNAVKGKSVELCAAKMKIKLLYKIQGNVYFKILIESIF